MKRSFDFDRYSPPGYSTLRLQGVFLWLMIILVLWGLSFLVVLGENVTLLTGDRYEVIRGVADFGELIHGRLIGLPIGMVAMAVAAVINYSCFFRSSKSIYLMRRLPDRWELHRRCLALPAMGCGVLLVTAIVLFGVCVVSYRLTIPKEYLPDDWVRTVIESVITLKIFGV